MINNSQINNLNVSNKAKLDRTYTNTYLLFNNTTTTYNKRLNK